MIAASSSKQKAARKLQTIQATRRWPLARDAVLVVTSELKKIEFQDLKSDDGIRTTLNVNAVDKADVFRFAGHDE